MIILDNNWEENLLKMHKPYHKIKNQDGYINKKYPAKRMAGTVKARIKELHKMLKAGTAKLTCEASAIVKTN